MVEESTTATGPRVVAHPTMADVAERAGVSRPLVSMVMRDKPGPSQESRERILAAARELGYRPNASARLLRRNRTKLIGAIFWMGSPFQVRVVERLFSAAAERGYGIALGPTTPDRSTDAVIDQLIEERVEALFAFNIDPDSPEFRDAASRIPTVLLGEWNDDAHSDNVHIDDDEALRLVVEHLVSLGHRDIAYVGGEGGIVGRDRAVSYLRAMKEFGLEERSEVIRGSFFEEDGAAAAREIVGRTQRPTALVCAGDLSAVGALAVFAQAGLSVPDDISVVGFDDSYVASLSYNRLTTVHQDVDATADATLGALLGRLDDVDRPPARIATPAALVIRATTGPAPSA
ncbi:LacI family DNA-binding transcriptional regulator [Microbacterium phyllosphaerae]|uniref:LacI family DNA-binding transcriptional regulator n=1 Tax=Microbacterium phyllosphaerae TaxID=124798 RepID=UPI002166F504|nr:LacI family DNA-binding transcriptional regulator [Microbacterium phyllosphaerae]MCS3443263.1 DNA-binding LacI/PurR family transcriptional regulator [Microbacterium phyllosphaerae]